MASDLEVPYHFCQRRLDLEIWKTGSTVQCAKAATGNESGNSTFFGQLEQRGFDCTRDCSIGFISSSSVSYSLAHAARSDKEGITRHLT